MASQTVEIEIKKRIGSKDAYSDIEQRLLNLSNHSESGVVFAGKATQIDVFVDQDGKIRDSLPQFSVLRIRRADNGRNVITIKGPTILISGVARADEDEVSVDIDIADSLASNYEVPLSHYNIPLLNHAVQKFGLDPSKGLNPVGQYTTIRSKFAMKLWEEPIWNATGRKESPILELDETVYDFGRAFEIEV
ncbi:hypothetical protein HK100_011648 [Physocladia obscura]|uniref:CYTH domain-containing protein n=1 Tax=Physocladia obscura TaxID=109957 RepID=A0AAD5T0W6_9FUNG|nr:hypothetical protein HK100_011648 [Physocladia obscura]